MTDKPLLFTGAGGALGTWLRPHLAEKFGPLRSSDIVRFGPALANEEIVQADLADKAAVEKLVAGTRAVVHFGGISTEDTFERIFESNFRGTYHVFDAARRHGLDRIVFASSNHAIGFHASTDRLDATAVQRPDTIYGLSKAFGEDLGRYLTDKFGMKVACLRIGTAIAQPGEPRHLSTWLSLPDLFRLISACLTAPTLTFAVVYGASANDRGWWDNSQVGHLGWKPQDNAEAFAPQVIPHGDTRDRNDPAVKFQGGGYCSYGYMDRGFVAEDRALLDGLMASLIARTRSCRAVARLDLPVRRLTLARAGGEACGPGVRSLRDETGIDPRATETTQWLIQERRTLVQNSFGAPPNPPQALIDAYGVKAWIVAPIFADQALVGWVALHETEGARKWTPENIAAVEAAATEVRRAFFAK